jgi:predicted RecA/RadA family phage recombinase
MEAYVREKSIPETIMYASSSAVSVGEVIYVAGLGVLRAMEAGAANESIAYAVKGVFNFPIYTAVTVAQGDACFWDASENKIILTGMVEGDFFLGYAISAGTAAAGYVDVEINNGINIGFVSNTTLVGGKFPIDCRGTLSTDVAASWYACIQAYTTLTHTQTHDTSTFAMIAEHDIAGGTIVLGGNCAAFWADLEISGTSVTTKGSTSTYVGAIVATIINTATALVNNDIMAGVIADSVITSSGVTNNTVIAAFAAIVSPSHATKRSWDCGLYLLGCDNVFSFNGAATAYLNAVKITSSTISGTCSALAKVRDTLNGVTYYLPLYGSGEVTNE